MPSAVSIFARPRKSAMPCWRWTTKSPSTSSEKSSSWSTCDGAATARRWSAGAALAAGGRRISVSVTRTRPRASGAQGEAERPAARAPGAGGTSRGKPSLIVLAQEARAAVPSAPGRRRESPACAPPRRPSPRPGQWRSLPRCQRPPARKTGGGPPPRPAAVPGRRARRSG